MVGATADGHLPAGELPAIELGTWLKTWLRIAVTSFGGGPATTILIQRAVVDDHRWLTDDEFARLWTVARMSPGINLVSLTIILGMHLGGPLRTCLAVMSLLLPSAMITVAITAAYTTVKDSPVMAAALRGIIPATVGFTLAFSVQVGRAALKLAGRDGRTGLSIGLLLLVVSPLAVAMNFSVIAVLVSCGLLNALLNTIFQPR